MDLNTGDGADSAEDSGSSQPYPSTIPGIPKARVFNFSSPLEFFLSSTSEQILVYAEHGKYILQFQ